MTSHDHDHHHHDHDHSELSETELRVRALETILTEKGYVDPAALDAIIQAYETKIGPHNGAQVVAKAWSDPAFKRSLLEDASKAVSTLGHVSRVGDHLVAVENTPERPVLVALPPPPEPRGPRAVPSEKKRPARPRPQPGAGSSERKGKRELPPYLRVVK